MRPAPGRAFVAACVLLAGCAGGTRIAAPLPAPVAIVGPASPLAEHPGFGAADLGPALDVFRRSCSRLVARTDVSGLTESRDWTTVCAAAVTATDPRAFFTTALVPVVVGDGRGLDTGYYEPELVASRTRATGFAVPLYRRPPDLIEADLGAFSPDLAGRKLRGRVAGGAFVPYFDRAAIDDGALAGRGLELAWAADPYEAFFLEIQGSGRLRLPDGTVLRAGYDGQNGHAYTAIGKLLRDRGALPSGGATMAGIIGWMRADPAAGRALMRENRSFVFFRETKTAPELGPTGALGVPLTPQASVAVDPRALPLGAPLWLDTVVGGAPFRRLVVAQDTGGAIKGANRLDIFWGSGAAAGAVAGALSATGAVTLLLPPAAAERLRRGPPPAP